MCDAIRTPSVALPAEKVVGRGRTRRKDICRYHRWRAPLQSHALQVCVRRLFRLVAGVLEIAVGAFFWGSHEIALGALPRLSQQQLAPATARATQAWHNFTVVWTHQLRHVCSKRRRNGIGRQTGEVAWVHV